eukprot:1690449-Prymnesium_polylepis.3
MDRTCVGARRRIDDRAAIRHGHPSARADEYGTAIPARRRVDDHTIDQCHVSMIYKHGTPVDIGAAVGHDKRLEPKAAAADDRERSRSVRGINYRPVAVRHHLQVDPVDDDWAATEQEHRTRRQIERE